MGNKTSTASTLPTFKLGDDYHTPLGPKNKETHVIEVLCQRSWCQCVFVVSIEHFWKRNIWERRKRAGKVPGIAKGNKTRTRACPCCNNMHKMPKHPLKG